MKGKAAILLCGAALLGGCTHLTSPARAHVMEANTPYWLDYDASRRGTIVAPASSRVKTCSEPSPDVALSLIAKIEASAKAPEAGEASGTAEFNTSVVKLAERTQMVMFLRESLYRLCEQSMNNEFGKEEIIASYNKVIDTARAIAEADKQRAVESAARAKESAAEAASRLTPAQAESIR